MFNPTIIFIALVTLAAFIIMLALLMPVFGENSQSRKRLRARLRQMSEDVDIPQAVKLLREDQLGKLGPLERKLETSSWLVDIRALIEQSGHKILAYHFVLLSLGVGIMLAVITYAFTKVWLVTLVLFIVGCTLLYLRLSFDKAQRMARFEEQLPEAIDIMRRALQAGHPFNESLKLVGEELDDPIRSEFALTFAELNYGNDLRWALMGLLERAQSVNVMALVTAVLIQRETGGNLAEILGNLSSIIRGRFRFHRKVKTLSAEGRLSAWILGMVPFAMFAMIHFTTPTYLPILIESDIGIKLCVAAFIGLIIGMLWIKRIIRIDV